MAANFIFAIGAANCGFPARRAHVAISHRRGVAVAAREDTMTKIVNLNKFRKQKAKDARVKQAETNRRLHGRTKAERAREALQKKKLETAVDHARLAPPSDTDASHTDDDSAPESS